MPPFHMQRNDHAFLSFAIQRKSGLNWRDPSLFLTRFQVERKEGRGKLQTQRLLRKEKKEFLCEFVRTETQSLRIRAKLFAMGTKGP